MSSSDTNTNSTNDQKSENQSSNDSSQPPDLTSSLLPVVYDDELDEKFEDSFAKTATTAEMKTTLESFDNPLGLEESPESPVLAGPQLDQKEVERFRKQIMNMPKNELMNFFRNIATQNNLGLGENNFRSVTGDHRNDIKNKLRQKLDQRSLARKPKDVRTREIERRQASVKELKKKDGADQNLPDAANPDISALLENLSNTMNENDAGQASDSQITDGHVHDSHCDHTYDNNNLDENKPLVNDNEDSRETMTTLGLTSNDQSNKSVNKSELTKKQVKQLTKKQEKAQVKSESFSNAKNAIKENSDVMTRSTSEQNNKRKSKSQSDKTKKVD